MKFINLVVLICDSLRYDYVPNFIKAHRAIAPSLYTSTSIASLITARSPENHNVRSFDDVLDSRFNTIFDFFANKEYYDHPYSAMIRVLGFKIGRKPKELLEMREPFIWVERLMESHIPYGEILHGNELSKGLINGRNYVRLLKNGTLNPYKEYKRGIRRLVEHIRRHLDELESAGLTERTLVMICSDHGEILKPIYSQIHNWPPCRQLVEVPVAFIPEQKKVSSCMRLIDAFPTALDLMGLNSKLGNGKSCVGVDETVIGTNMAYQFITKWKCTKEGTIPIRPLLIMLYQLEEIFLSRLPTLRKYIHMLLRLNKE